MNDVLQHHLVERQVGDEALEFGIFVAQLLQLAGFAGRHPAVDLLPAIEGLLGDPDLAADVPDGHAALDLLQDGSDLLDGKALFLHGILLARRADYAATLTSGWSEKPGAPHEDNRLRVTSTLVRVRDQVQVWSQSYDREPMSLLGLQRELSTAIAEQIVSALSPGRLETLTRRQTLSPDAYDLYLRGRNFENQRTPATNRRAIEYYTRATELDPDYALAWSAIRHGSSREVSSTATRPLSEVLPRARDGGGSGQSGRVLPRLRRSSLSRYLKWCCEWEWPGGGSELTTCADTRPGTCARGHLTLGHALSQMGRHGEALLSTRRARELDPLSAIMPALSSQVAFQARDYRAALDHARQAIVLDPELWIEHMMRGQALEQLGEHESALEALTIAARFSGENSKALPAGVHPGEEWTG